MKVNKFVKQALAGIGVPVSVSTYKGNAETYVTFFEMLEQGENFADDREIATGHYVQVDVWRKGESPTETTEAVKAAMGKAGFVRRESRELYESEANIYHRALRFYIKEETGNA